MKRFALVFALIFALALPAVAAPRDDDPADRSPLIKKIVRVIRAVLQPLDDGPLILPPHP